jgi:hypothetical protein
MITQNNFVQSLLAEQAALDDFFRGLTPAQKTQRNVCGTWSTKDVFLHLPVWARYMTSMLRAWVRQRPVTQHEMWGLHTPDRSLSGDALNQWFVDRARDVSFDQAYGTLCEVHAQMIGTVQLLSDEELNTPGLKIPGLGYTNTGTMIDAVTNMGFGHVKSHLNDLRVAFAQ